MDTKDYDHRMEDNEANKCSYGYHLIHYYRTENTKVDKDRSGCRLSWGRKRA